ncbi:MAG: hypothetical protein ACOY3Y_20655 [Acidobacteriota bacterium]
MSSRDAMRPLLLVALLAAPSPARAEEGPHSAVLVLGKLGGLIPVTKLSPHVSVRLGAGYLLPVLKRRLAAVVDLGYSQNTTDGTVQDPRLGASGASFSYTMTQRDLNLFIGPQLYLLDPFRRLVPHVALGVDLHFLRSVVEGEGAGQDLGGNDETSTKAGFALRGGLGLRLGPGLVTGELTFSWVPIDHAITGESHLGRLAILVGYTAILGLGGR